MATTHRKHALQSVQAWTQGIPGAELLVASCENVQRGCHSDSRVMQAMESQVPPPKFPSTLASFVLVFEIDPEWDPDEE